MAEQMTDDALREAARAACRAGGIDPDAMKMVPGSPNMRPAYEACLPQVRAALADAKERAQTARREALEEARDVSSGEAKGE